MSSRFRRVAACLVTYFSLLVLALPVASTIAYRDETWPNRGLPEPDAFRSLRTMAWLHV
jgi:hypothetical protein